MKKIPSYEESFSGKSSESQENNFEEQDRKKAAPDLTEVEKGEKTLAKPNERKNVEAFLSDLEGFYKTAENLGETFPSAEDLQKWYEDCNKIYSADYLKRTITDTATQGERYQKAIPNLAIGTYYKKYDELERKTFNSYKIDNLDKKVIDYAHLLIYFMKNLEYYEKARDIYQEEKENK